MRIFDGLTELSIPQWITASSNAITVTIKTGKTNGMHGERITDDEYYSVRTLKCQGTIITHDYDAVEKERSRLHDLLCAKLLRVYREDADTAFYECMLHGGVSVSYYTGQNTGRAFTISFTLKTLNPFMSGERIITSGKEIVYSGNHKMYPNFFFCGLKRFSGQLVSCNGTHITMKKAIDLRNDECLFYSNGCLYINRNGSNQNIRANRKGEAVHNKELVDITSFLAEHSIVRPPCVTKGVNVLEYHGAGTCVVFYNDVYK